MLYLGFEEENDMGQAGKSPKVAVTATLQYGQIPEPSPSPQSKPRCRIGNWYYCIPLAWHDGKARRLRKGVKIGPAGPGFWP